MDVQPRGPSQQAIPQAVIERQPAVEQLPQLPKAQQPIPRDHALVPAKSTAIDVPKKKGLSLASRGSLVVAGILGTVALVSHRVGACLAGAFAAIGDLGKAPWQTYRKPLLALPAAFPKASPVEVENVAPALQGMAFHSDHDLFYDGHFTMPGRADACVRMEDLLAKPNWVEIIRNDLTEGKSNEGDPLRVFIPGLNTPVKESTKRVKQFAQFTGLPMAQIQNGATTDFGNLEIPLIGNDKLTIPGPVRDWFQIGVQVLGAQPSAWANFYGKKNLALALGQLEHGNVELTERLQKFMIAYLDHPNPPKLELMPYSESTVVLANAFKTLEARYLAGKMEGVPKSERREQVKKLQAHFNERMSNVVVCSVGCAARGYETPAKIAHLYGWGENKDRVVEFFGPVRVWKPVRAVTDMFGKEHDALLPFEHPFPGFDAHNFIATGSHALALYLEQNKVTDLHGLWSAYQEGTLQTPSYDEVCERIKENKGEKYRWYKGPLGWGGL